MKFKQVEQENAITTMHSGRHIDLLNPEAMSALISIDDIGWHLAGIMRYNGGSSRLLSVAEHSLLGVPYCLPQNRLKFLLHDAPEAYLGDVTGPIKATSIYAPYRELEERWWDAIALRFGLSLDLPKEIDEVDKRMRYTEQRDLMGRRPSSTDSYTPFPMSISLVTPSREVIAERFIETFYRLTKVTVGARR